MGRTKSRTRKAFIGHRRNSKLKTNLKLGIEKIASQHQDEESLPEAMLESTSAQKLSFFGVNLEGTNTVETPEDDDCFIIVQKSALSKFFNCLSCPDCFKKAVNFDLEAKKFSGFSAYGTLHCVECSNVLHEGFLSNRLGGEEQSRNPFEVNILATLAFRGVGCGYSAMKEWCGTMNFPHYLSEKSYRESHMKIRDASRETFEQIRSTSLEAIRNAYSEIGVESDEHGVLDIGVSYDGSWQKRGHASHNGTGTVIELLTGLPIDFEVLSNFCQKCKMVEQSEEDTDNWMVRHKENCPKNFDGTSNSMEVECAVRLWRRSVEKLSLRYTVMLCDGDSKAYDKIVEMEVYGREKQVAKEECINHVSKRMGTALRKLIETSKARGESISGRGKLTQEKVLKIQNYYGRAIKDNTDDLNVLKQRIFAILFHLCSSDAHPKHIHCPPGANSWCFWQRDFAMKRTPGEHKEHDTLPAEVGKKLVPIFERLSDVNLLKRCVRGKTQNPNESFHGLIWKFCPKTIFNGRKVIETAVNLAACQFSMGSTFKVVLCHVLKIAPMQNMLMSANEKNAKRIKLAQKAKSCVSKKKRKQLKYKSINLDKSKKQVEGITYAAGNF